MRKKKNIILNIADSLFYHLARFYIRPGETVDKNGVFFVTTLIALWAVSFILVILGVLGLKLSSIIFAFIFYPTVFLCYSYIFKRYTITKHYTELCEKITAKRDNRIIKWVVAILLVIITLIIYVRSVLFCL